MLFSSPEFIFAFLPPSLLGYFAIARLLGGRASLGWLVLCSLFFYGYWRLEYLPLLIGSILGNYAIAAAIQAQQGTRRGGFAILIAGIAANLALLGYFKYAGFFAETANAALGTGITVPQLVLPLAISFFTFQQITYLVDSYKREAVRGSLLHYAVFVTFFPQLIAGPIVHHKEMMPQFARAAILRLRSKNLLAGLIIFGLGLFKKIGIADSFAVWADAGYADHTQLTVLDAWITTFSYTFQLYFDFSGYTDMAIGAARMFGIRLPLNFLSPYKAVSIQDFWRRWHITLSRFLRDYLYIPLGGSRRREGRVMANLMITFLLGGLWHGAGWTFILWGGIHGAALVIHRIWARAGLRLPRVIGWLLTFAVVHLSWVFFRATDLAQALDILSIMFGLDPAAMAGPRHVVIEGARTAGRYLLLALIGVLILPNTYQFTRDVRPLYKTLVGAVLFGAGCILMLVSRSDVFLYFNF
ncbi:D-alanyl-lipoteichoic acid acyltransferase DltB, MBOAT superfamily [Roseovarius nanhaiticus]|uniref:Probable alginate O-acetylase AlgI n=1 Tax=Roseovarius nanhaiticus TaxID=573024 RepID=A0A1N7FEI2_9RHOB|nr:MBOAT family protein [Roseovarius nanhaiticus]SEK56418.1 D-alanyl-lipoteichoic acid acyltransferase DltB, MBOAT superfamily [Roseovarius nanhaiticus]SIR98690.1 D-alanyl-lipoteichoic acid acyltransferase DltB, MBOAT superfamily [Roseovarius nanhaiticus]